MGFSRRECWSGLPFPSPGDLPNSGIEPVSRIAGRRFTVWATREATVILNGLEMNRDHSVVLKLGPNTALGTLINCEGYSISSKGFFLAVVDIMVFWVKFQSILVHWLLKCWCSLLPSPVWPLPICLDSWTWHSGSYAVLFFTALNFTSITSHIHNWVLFLFGLSLFVLSRVISPLFSSSMLGTYWPGEFTFQCFIFLPVHSVHGLSREEHWRGLPFPSPVDHILSDLSSMTCLSWVAPPGMAQSFTELDKGMVSLISFL